MRRESIMPAPVPSKSTRDRARQEPTRAQLGTLPHQVWIKHNSIPGGLPSYTLIDLRSRVEPADIKRLIEPSMDLIGQKNFGIRVVYLTIDTSLQDNIRSRDSVLLY